MRAKQLYSGLLVRFQFQLNQQIDVVPYHKKHLVWYGEYTIFIKQMHSNLYTNARRVFQEKVRILGAVALAFCIARSSANTILTVL